MTIKSIAVQKLYLNFYPELNPPSDDCPLCPITASQSTTNPKPSATTKPSTTKNSDNPTTVKSVIIGPPAVKAK